MADWHDSNGQVHQTGLVSLQDLAEGAIGTDATYTPISGAPRAVRGIKKARRETLEDISENVGRVDSAHRFKMQRRDHSVADFPADPEGSTYGQLSVAGQDFAIIGVAYEGTSHTTLFLSDPIT